MENDRSLQAGFARVDITPDFSVGLDGYHNEETRRSQGVRDPIYLTCIAVSEAEETILIFDADLLSINDWLADQMRQVVCPATGIPADKMFFGATHTHSAPANYTDQEDSLRYRGVLLEAFVAAAKGALADLAPARMLTATKKIRGMNFVRNYLMEDGTYAGSNFGNNNIPFIGHAALSDPRLLLVQFAREEKPSIVMMNWQAHNDNVGQVGTYLLSSSYTGQVRAEFEQETGLHFAFVMGAAGNQTIDSRVLEERHGLNFVEYGKKMAHHAIETMKDLKPVTGKGIVTKQLVFEAPVNHSWDHMLEKANEVYQVWKTAGVKEGHALARSNGFSSAYQTKFIRTRAAMGETTPVVLNAFRIGDMAFVTIPNDTFSTVGIHVRLHSPFDSTFIITGNARYLASMAAYDYRSYEADSSLFVKGTAEKISDTLVDLLESIR